MVRVEGRVMASLRETHDAYEQSWTAAYAAQLAELLSADELREVTS